jgi:hypothetical protein
LGGRDSREVIEMVVLDVSVKDIAKVLRQAGFDNLRIATILDIAFDLGAICAILETLSESLFVQTEGFCVLHQFTGIDILFFGADDSVMKLPEFSLFFGTMGGFGGLLAC